MLLALFGVVENWLYILIFNLGEKMQRLKIIELSDGGAAEIAGLMVGDWLDEYNGVSLSSSEALSAAMRKSSGTHIMKVVRGLQRLDISIQAGPLGISVEPGEMLDVDNEWAVKNALILQKAQSIALSTTAEIAGYVADETLEVVTAECVFGMSVFKDFFAGVSDFFGGRSQVTQDTLRRARQTCLYELKVEAAKVGADAVIGVDLDYSEFSGQGKSMLFLVASGTAVKLKKV